MNRNAFNKAVLIAWERDDMRLLELLQEVTPTDEDAVVDLMIDAEADRLSSHVGPVAVR